MRDLLLALVLLIGVTAAVLGVVGWVAIWDTKLDYEHWIDENIDESRRRAEVLVEVLRAYHSVNGEYPPSLESLDADEVRRLPPTTGNPEWGYHVDEDGQRFVLSFSANTSEYPVSYYDSGTQQWSTDN